MTHEQLNGLFDSIKSSLKGEVMPLVIAMDEDGCTALNLPIQKPLEECTLQDLSDSLGEFMIEAVHSLEYQNKDLANVINKATIDFAISLIHTDNQWLDYFNGMNKLVIEAKKEGNV